MPSARAITPSSWRPSLSARSWSRSGIFWQTSRTGSPIRGFVFADSYAGARAAWRRLGTIARVALVVLVLLYLFALLAPIIAPYDPSQQLDIIRLKDHHPTFAN